MNARGDLPVHFLLNVDHKWLSGPNIDVVTVVTHAIVFLAEGERTKALFS